MIKSRFHGLYPSRAHGLITPDQLDWYCKISHDAYEKAAVGAGWETQLASRKEWADVPEANKATVRASMTAVLEELGFEVGPV